MMDTCAICNSEISEGDSSCNKCGYDLKVEKIGSEERLRAYYQQLREKHWSEEIHFKERLRSVLKYTVTGIAKLLGQSKSLISQDLKLARSLAEHPSLSESRNKYEASKKMQQLGEAFSPRSLEEIVEYEEQLQRYLWSNWSKTPFANEWRLVKEGGLSKGQYPAGKVGFIDLLAKHHIENKWLVIELKRDQASDTTVGQTLRYMGWVKENLADEESQVMGLIVSALPDEHIQLALKCVPSISLIIYRVSDEMFEFFTPDEANRQDLQRYLQGLSREEKESILKQLTDPGS